MENYPSRILLVRGCRNEKFLSVLKMYREDYPKAKITLMLLEKMMPDAFRYNDSDEIIYFPASNVFHAKPPKEFLQKMLQNSYELGSIAMNNHDGEGYDRLKSLLFKLGCKSVESVNATGSVETISHLNVFLQYRFLSRFMGLIAEIAIYGLCVIVVYSVAFIKALFKLGRQQL